MRDWIKFIFAAGKDKWMHFSVCIILTLVVFAICFALGLGKMAIVPAIVVTALVGVGKEIYDKKKTGLFEQGDILADMFGIMIGCIIALIIVI